jgi:hypothetical protein
LSASSSFIGYSERGLSRVVRFFLMMTASVTQHLSSQRIGRT